MGIRSTVEGLNQGPEVSLNLVVRLLSALHHESCDMCDMYCIVLRSSGCVAQNNLVPEQKPSIQACAVEPRDSKPKAEEPPPPKKKMDPARPYKTCTSAGCVCFISGPIENIP